MPWLGPFTFRCPSKTKERTQERASQALGRVHRYYAHAANVSKGPPHTTCWCHFFSFTSSWSVSSSSSVQHRGTFQLRLQFISSYADHGSVLLNSRHGLAGGSSLLLDTTIWKEDTPRPNAGHIGLFFSPHPMHSVLFLTDTRIGINWATLTDWRLIQKTGRK